MDELPTDQENCDEVEPEAEDVDPNAERSGVAEGTWDSSDDEADEGDLLCPIERALPAGYTVIEEPPAAELLEQRSERAEELVDRQLLFNWRGVGWVSGRIVRSNTDRRKQIKVAGVFELVNYVAF